MYCAHTRETWEDAAGDFMIIHYNAIVMTDRPSWMTFYVVFLYPAWHKPVYCVILFYDTFYLDPVSVAVAVLRYNSFIAFIINSSLYNTSGFSPNLPCLGTVMLLPLLRRLAHCRHCLSRKKILLLLTGNCLREWCMMHVCVSLHLVKVACLHSCYRQYTLIPLFKCVCYLYSKRYDH
jgi:hypothetical protein